MKINTLSPLKVLLLSFIFILHLSCSKDYDLFVEYALRDTQEVGNGKNVVDDTFWVSQKGIIVLDVLSNDGYTEQDNVSIKETSAPMNGSVEINTNNTLTYTPHNIEEPSVTDAVTVETFTDTPEVVNEDQSVTIEEPPVTDAVTVETFTDTPEVVNENQSVTIEEPPVTDAVTVETFTDTPEVVNENQSVTTEEPPVTDAVTVETFTYTTEVVNEDQSVTTEEGTVTIVIDPEASNSTDCATNGGLAGDTGLKTWCWGDVTLPTYSGSKGVSFSNSELVIDSECYEKQVTKVGNRLKFNINPTTPEVGNWCSRNYNMRAEIRTAPWDVRHPKGTEEWFGWSYTFGDDYIIDKHNQWLFWQVHHGVVGDSPQTELMVIKDGQFSGHSAGEIYVVNNTTSTKYNPTGITPRAGQKLDIVVHVVWDDASNGLLQVWMNGQSIYDKQVSTVYSSSPWAGNAKWGIYKWPWAEQNGVQASQQQGITHLETFMGSLRIITRRPGDTDYGKNSYSVVVPN